MLKKQSWQGSNELNLCPHFLKIYRPKRSVSWLWSDWSLSFYDSRPHRTESTKAEQVNTNTETARQVRKQIYLPAWLIFLIHLLSRAEFHIITTMTATLILRPLTEACRSLYLFPTTTKESMGLFCIHALGGPTKTAVLLQLWQYPAGSLGVVRSGLVITEHCQNTNRLQQSVW